MKKPLEPIEAPTDKPATPRAIPDVDIATPEPDLWGDDVGIGSGSDPEVPAGPPAKPDDSD
jgi:hypothetical protein